MHNLWKKCTGVFWFVMLFVTAAIFTAVIDVFLVIEMADAGTHRIKIACLCRFCVARLRLQERSLQHPQKNSRLNSNDTVLMLKTTMILFIPNVCPTCVGYFYRLRRSPSSHALGKIPITWKPHKDSECTCTKDSRGRPSKRKRVDVEDGSDPESGEDDGDEAEKDSCNMFHNISENHLDKELALVLCKNICSQFGLLFIDPENMYSSMRAIDR